MRHYTVGNDSTVLGFVVGPARHSSPRHGMPIKKKKRYFEMLVDDAASNICLPLINGRALHARLLHRRGTACQILPAMRSRISTPVARVEWHPMTWRAQFGGPIARRVVGTHFEFSFLEVSGIL